MNAPIALRDLMADWLDAIDPEAENRYRQQQCREAYDRGHDAGFDTGYMCAVAEIKAVQQDLVRVLGDLGETLAKRWHLCCRPCRANGHKRDCADCEDRTQATFSQPMVNDQAGTVTA